MYARASIPADPLERRRLWREWINMDLPVVERTQRQVHRERISGSTSASTAGPVRVEVKPASHGNASRFASTSPTSIAQEVEQIEGDWLPEMLSAPPGVIAGLRRAIEECLHGDRLPIRDRERLLRRAVKLGLNRFEANLLLAAVQHRARDGAMRGAMPSERSDDNASMGGCHDVGNVMDAETASELSASSSPDRWTLTRLLAAAVAVEAVAIGVFVRWLI